MKWSGPPTHVACEHMSPVPMSPASTPRRERAAGVAVGTSVPPPPALTYGSSTVYRVEVVGVSTHVYLCASGSMDRDFESRAEIL